MFQAERVNMNLTRNALLLIDAQYDFCHPQGALYVKGADEDMLRLADWIKRNTHEIDFICFTMDQHLWMTVFHPIWFQDKNGQNPSPFTTISASDVVNGKWIAQFHPQETLRYLENLEAQGQFTHTIWPPHCLIGSKGASLFEPVAQAIFDWAKNGKEYLPVSKGTHPLTEHYGIFQAQIPIANEPSTQLNIELIQKLDQYDRIFISGEAQSHCVATSIDQLLTHAPETARKMIILSDCMSPVPGFEHLADDIYRRANGLMKNMTSKDAII
jgi:nicotinamidase-related amidase